MKKSLFAGLSILDPGEPLSDDNGAFTGRDREATDHFLELGAKTHRHDGTSGLVSPSAAPVFSVLASGGSLPPSTGISLGYTLEDESRGETLLSPTGALSTPGAIEAPAAVPTVVVSTAAGSLLVNTYYYALTFVDGEGGETPLGPAATAQRQPGFEHSEVELSGLDAGMAEAGAAGWRLYRAVGGGAYNLLESGTGATFTDDGSHSLDCSTHPPSGSTNTTHGTAQLRVTLPPAPTGTAFINLYASVTGDFSGGSLLGRFPAASAGAVTFFPSLELSNQSPPPVNRSVGGAHQIDPDTELIDWHWKRPVADHTALLAASGAEEGDVRFVIAEATPYFYTGTEWKKWTIEGTGGGGGALDVFLEGGFPGGEPFSITDPFETLDDEVWGINGGGKATELFKAEAGHLIKIGGGPIERTDVLLENGVVTLKLNRGTAGFFECSPYLGIPAVNQRLRCGITGTNFEIVLEPHEGSNETLATTSFTAAENTDYWHRLTKEGTKVLTELFTSDPTSGSPSPVASVECTLNAEEPLQASFLGATHPGIFFVGSSGGYVDTFTATGEDEGANYVAEAEFIEFKDGASLAVAPVEAGGKSGALVTIPSRAGAMGYVNCGTEVGKARPEYDGVTWLVTGGSGEPTHMANGDVLIEEESGTVKQFVKLAGSLVPIE